MPSPNPYARREKALEKKKELIHQLLNRQAKKKPASLQDGQTNAASEAREDEPSPPVRVELEHSGGDWFRSSHIPLYKDGESDSSKASSALIELSRCYLETAHNKNKRIALLWPTAPKTLLVTHALATLERWAKGDKRGIRGMVFPAKTNVFHPLNHIHFDRPEILKHATKLLENPSTPNPIVTRSLSEKDAYLFSMASLKADGEELFHPTIGEILPRFYAGEGFKKWEPCVEELLGHISARLVRRAHKKALRTNCDFIGTPRTAPDALFALDGRMSKEMQKSALVALKREGAPEVVLVNATRSIRIGTRGWARQVVRFCGLVDEVFGRNSPGILVVTDDPHAAFTLKKLLTESDAKPDKKSVATGTRDYWITAICSGVREDGLLPPGQANSEQPLPREFDVEIVDTEASRVISRLYRIAGRLPGGRDSALPVVEAAQYLAKLAAMPCGVTTIVEWLSSTEASDHTRRAYSWSTYHAALCEFSRSPEIANEGKNLLECLELGTTIYDHYQGATPFALRLAELVGVTAEGNRRRIVVVFTSAIYRRLAEKFLKEYSEYPGGAAFSDFSERIELLASGQLEEHLDRINGARLVFAGLNDDSLRLLMMDNRIPKHSILLLTQRAGQYLRGILTPLVEKFEEFKPLKPRIESILRQLQGLPEDHSILSVADYVLPAFRTELLPTSSGINDVSDPEAWRIQLESHQTIFWRGNHRVYVYDPASEHATDRGFRGCEVHSLREGDKLFVMSPELREHVELVLKEAGIPIEHDKTFEGALRDYHRAVTKRLQERFPNKTLIEQVRQLRKAILLTNPKLTDDFPADVSVRHWVNLGESADTPFEQLRPQAPRKESHFMAFAKELGFSALEGAYFWQRVIMPVRNTRRTDGRHVSDMYAYMLLQPESAMVHSSIKRQTLKLLFQKARENVVAIESIVPPKETSRND